MSVQYSGGCAVQWRLFSTVEAVQYSGGVTSALWGDSIEYGGGYSVQWRANISTVEG